MTDPNNTDENNEALVNPNPEKFKKFLLKKSFKLAKDNLKEQGFYDKFVNGKYDSSDFFDDLISNLSSEDKSKYKSQIEKLDDDAKNDLYKNFSEEIKLHKNIVELKQTELLKYYEKKYILNKIQEKILKSNIGKLTEVEVLNLLEGVESKRKNYIKNLFPSSTPQLKELNIKDKVKQILSNAGASEELKQRIITKIGQAEYDNQNAELRATFYKLSTMQSIDESIVIELFEFNIFSLEDKKYFLSEFVPFLSLKKLKDLGIINQEEAVKIIKKELLALGKSEDEIDYITKIPDLNTFTVNTEDIFSNLSEKQIDIIGTEVGIAGIFKNNYNESISKIRENLLKNLLTLEAFHQQIEQNQQIKSKIINYEKFKEKFVNGSILKLTLKGENSKETSYSFMEIVNFNDDGSFSYLDRSYGANQYDTSNNLEVKTGYYKGLQDLFGKNNIVEIEVLNQKEIRTKLNSGELNEYFDELNLKTVDDFKELSNKKDELEGKLANTTDPGEIMHLTDELDILKAKIGTDVNDFNLKDLEIKINLLDSEGAKYGLKNGVSFKITKPGSELEGEIYTINYIDLSSHKIEVKNSIGKLEVGTYQEFYILFKDFNPKRFSNNTSFSEFPNLFSGNEKIGKTWDLFEIKNDHIQKKETEKAIIYDYLVANSQEGDELIKIHSVNGGMVKISFGKIIEEGKTNSAEKDDYPEKEENKSAKKEKKSPKKITFETENEEYDVSIGFLEDYIKSKSLEPRSLDEQKDKKKEALPEGAKGRTTSIWNKIFSNKSINEIIKGLEIGVDSIKHYLKESNEEHANAAALAIYGKFLPEELHNDLRSRVEQGENKHMEDYIKKLSSVDSPIATAIIGKRLMRKNTPPHKLEAGLFFMMENYGTLYTKNIYKYKGKFLWYEALGGTIGDKLFHEVKDKAAGLNIQFSEEVLVHSLLKKQCYGHGFKGIHRRSRIHKEYEWKWKAGLQKDNEKGKKDADSKRTIEGRIEGAMGELTTGTYPNAMGWFELIIGKGGPMDKMNKIPFIMLFSGLGYSINEKMADKFKNLMKAGLNIPAVRFISNISDIELFNRTVVELSKRLTEVYGSKDKRYLYMHDRAKKILVNQKKGKNEVEQINAAANFFDDYGEILTRSMYMLNTGKNDELNYADKLIFLEKDENPTFNEYFNTFRVFIDREVNYGEASYMTDGFKQAGLSGYYLQKFTVDVLKYRNGGNFASNVGNDALFEVEREFLAIPNRNYGGGKKNDKEVKSMLIRDNLRQFIAGILINHSSDAKVLESINMPGSHFSRIFDRYGVNLTEFNKNNINAGELISGKNVIAEKILDRYVSNAFDGKDHSKDRGVLGVVQNVGGTILDTLNNKPGSND